MRRVYTRTEGGKNSGRSRTRAARTIISGTSKREGERTTSSVPTFTDRGMSTTPQSEVTKDREPYIFGQIKGRYCFPGGYLGYL